MKDELILEDFLPYRLSITSHTVSTNIARIYEKRFGVSIPEWRVIAILGRFPGLSAVEVAERTLMDKVAVSRAVTKLIKNGRIDRQFADADRRRSILKLSEEGQKVHNEIAPLALEFERQLVEDISEEDYERFNSILEQLLDKARQLGI
ncbi:MAG: MarR family transcriptional regulator [Woeseiaceae bacterium]|nr:MarR family transcriptional regulator [Woeseiaceae bacterium]